MLNWFLNFARKLLSDILRLLAISVMVCRLPAF